MPRIQVFLPNTRDVGFERVGSEENKIVISLVQTTRDVDGRLMVVEPGYGGVGGDNTHWTPYR